SDNDGLDVLRPHNCADARAAGGPGLVVDDAGDAIQVLTSGADAGDARRRIGLGAERVLRLFCGLAPNVRGIADLELVVLNPDVDGLGRPAFEDDHVVAGELELGAPVAAGAGFSAMSMRTIHSIGSTSAYSRASYVQILTHWGSPPQRSQLWETFLSSWKPITLNGQATMHILQPMHLSSFIWTMPLAPRVMA